MSLISPIRSGSCAICRKPSAMPLHGFFGERQPVDRGRIQSIGFGSGDILGILGDESCAAVQNGIRDGNQRAVLRGGVSLRHQARSGASLLPDGLHVLL